jgi:hypothetical protein
MYTSSVAVTFHTAGAIVERCLDIPGYIPGLSFINLPLRITLAALQTLCALASVLRLSALYLTSRDIRETRLEEEWSKHMAYFASNAFQNICRGFIESTPILGNVLCFMWDWQKSQQTGKELEGSFGPVTEDDWHRPLIANLHWRNTRSFLLF